MEELLGRARALAAAPRRSGASGGSADSHGSGGSRPFDSASEASTFFAHATAPNGTVTGLGINVSDLGLSSPALTYLASHGSAESPPDSLAFFSPAGFAFARSGWGENERDFADETFVATSFGPAELPDGGFGLAFCSQGALWLGAGSGAGPRSVPHLEGVERNPKAAVEGSWRTTDDLVELTFRDSGYRDSVLTRTITYSTAGEYLLIHDRVVSATDVTAVANFDLATGIVAEQDVSGIKIYDGDRAARFAALGGALALGGSAGSNDKPVTVPGQSVGIDAAGSNDIAVTARGQSIDVVTFVAAGVKGIVPEIREESAEVVGVRAFTVTTGRVTERIALGDIARILGPDEQVTAAMVHGQGGAVLDPADPSRRAAVFDAIESARERARSLTESERLDIANELRTEFGSLQLLGGVDLGLDAALADFEGRRIKGLDLTKVRKDRPCLINWDDAPGFTATFEKLPVRTGFGELPNVSGIDRDTLLSVGAGPLVLPALVAPAQGRVLTVMLSGAVDRARMNLPVFSRMRIQRGLKAGPILNFADPTLDLGTGLGLGWYLGTERVDLAPLMAQVAQRVAEALGAERIVVVGPSGGGFAAMQVAAFIPGAHTVAMNPQVDVSRYYSRHVSAVYRAAFGCAIADLPEYLRPRTNVLARFDEMGRMPELTLFQNTGDEFHAQSHARPLREYATAHGHTIHVVEENTGPGHRMPSNDTYAKLMAEVYARLGA